MCVEAKIYEVMEEKHFKQASIAVAAGYTPKMFNNLLKGRKKMTNHDILPICKALDITPNELFNYEKPADS